jgi:hypothetical protein
LAIKNKIKMMKITIELSLKMTMEEMLSGLAKKGKIFAIF